MFMLLLSLEASYETAVAEMELIDQLAALRKERKITQTEVAKRMKTTQAAVLNIQLRLTGIEISQAISLCAT